MKRPILSILCLLFPLWLSAQVSDTTVCIGKNLITGADITATRFDFPGTLYNVHISGKDNVVMTATGGIKEKGRGKNGGEVNIIALDSDSVIYRCEYKNARYFIDFSDQFIFQQSRNKPLTRYMDPYDDILYFKANGMPVLDDLYESKYLNLSNHALSMFNKEGKELWQVPVDFNNGVKEFIFEEKDSSLLVCTGGIRKVHLAYGNGWKFEENTRVTEKGAVWKSLALGVVAGTMAGLTRSPVVVNLNSSPITYYNNVCSNIIIHNDLIYWASMSKIVCLNYYTGITVWETPLKKRTMGSSEIVLVDDHLWLLNRGCIGPNSEFYEKRGVSSVMKFDCDNGELMQSVELNDIAIHYVFDPESMELRFTGEHGIYLFALDDMEMKTVFNYDNSGWYRPYFMREDIFFEREDKEGFTWMYQNMPYSTAVLRKNKDEAVFIDMYTGEEIGTCMIAEVFFISGDFNHYTILTGPGGSAVMNMEQNKISEFECTGQIYRKGDYLLWHNDGHIYKILLADLIPDYSVDMEGEIYHNDLIL